MGEANQSLDELGRTITSQHNEIIELRKDKDRLDSVLPTLKKYNLGTRQ